MISTSANVCRGLLVLIATFIAISTAVAFEAEPSADAKRLEADVARFIEKLDADTRAERAAAEKGLLDFGPKALDSLPAPAQIRSPAAREAVRRVRTELELRKAKESVAASRASLQPARPLREQLDSLSHQTGNDIDLTRFSVESLDRNVTLRTVKSQDFWQSLEQLSAAGRFELDGIVSGEIRLHGVAGAAAKSDKTSLIAGELASQVVGAFRISASKAQIRPKVSERIPQRLRFELAALAEPRLRPLFMKFSAADFQASIVGGETLKPTNPTAQIELPFGERGGVAQLDFNLPDKAEPSEVSLRGKFVALTAAVPERFEFSDVAKAAGVSRRRGGVTVTVDKVEMERKQANAAASITIIVAYDNGGPAFESHRSWYFQNEAWMANADNKRIDMAEPPLTSRQSDGAITVEYKFRELPADAANCRFVYVAPTLLIDVPVPFEFPTLPVAK